LIKLYTFNYTERISADIKLTRAWQACLYQRRFTMLLSPFVVADIPLFACHAVPIV